MEETTVQTPGAPWKNVAYKATFEEADEVRNSRLQEEGIQAKVKFMPSMGKFAVKVRRDPFLVLQEQLVTKKNKKRKKKNA